MRPIKTFLPLIAVILLSLVSCEQPEGIGGDSGIKGVLVTRYYNADYSLLISESPAVDEEVFLLFGDSEFVDDKVETSNSGAFEFPYLYEGSYTLYFTGEDSASSDNEEVVHSYTVDIDAGQMEDLGTIYRYETLDYNDGTSAISGKIKLINYKNSSMYPFMEVKDTSWAQDYEVYLIYGNNIYYDERIRTSYDGTFQFPDLIPGSYKVFVFSEDITGATENITIIKNVTITEMDQHIDLGIIEVEQL